MLGRHRPKIVITIHGIRTVGLWQKRITPYLAKHGLVPFHIDYGWFGLLRFLFPWTRNRQVQKVREEMIKLADKLRSPDHGVPRVSIIAHSFGTYIAMKVLENENGNLKYDRVVLTGSIVRRDFDWPAVLSEPKRWVMAVRNERALKDCVVTLAGYISTQAGASGREEFEKKSALLLDHYVVGHHSEVHTETKFEQWARFIAYPALPSDLLRRIREEMQAFRQWAARILGHEPTRMRANLFAPIGGALRIVPGAVDNMLYAPEYDLAIAPKHGATGSAFDSGSTCYVVKRGGSWTGNQLPGDELEKINPELKWVISLPVRSEARATTVAVLNIDGLDAAPGMLENANSVECQATLLALHGGMSQRFVPCLEAAFRGDQMPEVEA